MGSYFNGLTPGSTEFNNAWKTVSQKYGDNFGNMQMQYSYNNYALPLAKLAKEKTGVDYTSNPALMELIYSTAVQFGNGSLGLKALGNVKSGMSVTDIINASYDNKIANYKSYFKSSSSAVQESVKNRFINERRDVLALAGGGTGTNTNVKANTNSGGLVNTAKQYLGTPYVWGGSSTKGFDCSGFTQYVFKQNGITINRTARDQYKNGVAVDKSQLQPGDLVFFKGSSGSSSAPGHVGLYIGNGQFIHSPKTGDVVKVSGLDGRKDYVGARRIAG
ncbi:MAG: C40 family peptidase [Clostridia bacterium]|nr:C40 family peptidase [Clostridia bacterium]